MDRGDYQFSRADFLRGARMSLPILLGYAPVGFAFGVLAVNAGMSPAEAGLMCLFAYAGSGQLVAVGMLMTEAGAAAIIMANFIINLRHLLMSAAVSPYLRGWSKKLQAVYALEMTDETFAVDIVRFAEGRVNRDETLGLHVVSHLFWTGSGFCGALFGNVIGDIKAFGMDYALAAMFIALLVPHFRIPRRMLAALAGGVFSVTFIVNGVDQWNLVLATALSATLLMFLPDSWWLGAPGDKNDRSKDK